MNVDWTWLLVGLLVGVFFGGQLRGAASSLKSKATG